MVSQVQMNDTANAHGSAFRLISYRIQRAGQIAGVDHHAPVKTVKDFLLLRRRAHGQHQADDCQNDASHNFPCISFRRAS